MNNLQVLGKFLDQPILVAKFQKAVPAVLAGTTAAYTAYNTHKAPKEEKINTALKTGITLGIASASAVLAPKIASAITKRELPPSLNTLKENGKNIVDEFIASNNIYKKTKKILNKSKDKILNPKEVKTVFENLSDKKSGQEFLEKLIPSPQNITAKDIFSEIGYLSVLGAVPVAGGIIADKVTDDSNWEEKIPNKIKEGSYQYLANIFMCNVGAGAALGILEHEGITSKAARAIGMTAGIITTGILGGSKIANFIGKNIIDPVCNKVFNKKENNKKYDDILILRDCKKHNYNKKNKEFKERTPEILDIGLHTDDIATVSLLSGLKWIEPALPIMYTVSGYRAGIGYRN